MSGLNLQIGITIDGNHLMSLYLGALSGPLCNFCNRLPWRASRRLWRWSCAPPRVWHGYGGSRAERAKFPSYFEVFTAALARAMGPPTCGLQGTLWMSSHPTPRRVDEMVAADIFLTGDPSDEAYRIINEGLANLGVEQAVYWNARPLLCRGGTPRLIGYFEDFLVEHRSRFGSSSWHSFPKSYVPAGMAAACSG
jgi:hypothetical protein